MSFVAPLGLLALLALPLIVVLHLIRERRRKVAVPSLLLWANMPRRKQGERARVLPLTLLLLLHLLVAALLAFALARPQLATFLPGQPQQLAIVLDTSLSMTASSGTQTRFEQAQDQIRSLLASLGPESRAALITAGTRSQVVAAGTPGEIEPLLAALDGVQPGGINADLNSALTLAEAVLDPRQSGQIVVFTDNSATPPTNRNVLAPVDWRVIGASLQNRAIVDFSSRRIGNQQYVFLRVGNYGGPGQNVTVQLFADDQLVDTQVVNLGRDGETELTWTPPSGAQLLRAQLEGQDPLPADDQASLSLATVRQLNVLLVSAQPQALSRALQAVPGLNVTVVAPGTYAPGSQADLTIFDSFLPPTLENGATWIINPPPGSAFLPTTTLDSQQENDTFVMVDESARGSLLDGLSFGGVNIRRLTPPSEVPPWAQVLLEGARQNAGQVGRERFPLILRGQADSGEVAVWAFDVVDSNLPNRLAFPVLVARTVRELTPVGLPGSLASGAALNLRPSPRSREIVLTAPDGTTRQVAVQAFTSIEGLDQPGVYQVVEQANGQTIYRGQVPVNAGSVLESNLRAQPQPQFTVVADSPEVAAQRSGTDLWPWLGLAAVIVLLFEWGYLFRRRRAAF
jgi:hypothetical protein